MLSRQLEVSLRLAVTTARQKHHEFLTVEHLLLAIIDAPRVREILKAGGADIRWSCPAGTSTVPVADGCGPLQERPECRLQSTRCVAGTEEIGRAHV